MLHPGDAESELCSPANQMGGYSMPHDITFSSKSREKEGKFGVMEFFVDNEHS